MTYVIRLLQTAAALALLALLAVLGAAGSKASEERPELLGTMPAADAAVAEPPPLVRAVFDRPVEPGEPALEVVDADGQQVDEGDPGPGASPAVVEVSLPPDLPLGEYTATWRVRTGEDEELAEGQWRFRIGEDTGSRMPLILMALVALALAAGGVVFARRRLD